jgi:hypothetical protein
MRLRKGGDGLGRSSPVPLTLRRYCAPQYQIPESSGPSERETKDEEEEPDGGSESY